MKHGLVAICLAAMTAAGPATAQQGSPHPAENPTVVELFTSQSCYSCPPAEAYLGELAVRPEIIALEFHVDYWNDLVYGAAGRWTDVHSSPAFTERQRAYAGRLPGGRVYTPQMVIDGRAEAVGSRKSEVERAIAAARGRTAQRLTVAVASAANGIFAVQVAGIATESAEVWLVKYRTREATRVSAGENRGKTLVNHHVVTAVTPLGAWRGMPLQIETEPVALTGDEGCAVLVQSAAGGPILGAASCPGPSDSPR